jgi:hypothetical protein
VAATTGPGRAGPRRLRHTAFRNNPRHAASDFVRLAVPRGGPATPLDFASAEQLSGANSTVARAVQTINYTASHIVNTAP